MVRVNKVVKNRQSEDNMFPGCMILSLTLLTLHQQCNFGSTATKNLSECTVLKQRCGRCNTGAILVAAYVAAARMMKISTTCQQQIAQ
jgi:hypothetical protein